MFGRKHRADALSGEGARRLGGRWNPPGVAVVYASSSLALALLELMANARRGRIPPAMLYCTIELPDDARIERARATELPAKWFSYPAPLELQALGERWAHRGKSVALLVPSAIARIETNVLLNPNHADFKRLNVGAPQELPVDERLRSTAR